jgi:uncharacterized membrane-anchored protein YhcB (DUF1043 family)
MKSKVFEVLLTSIIGGIVAFFGPFLILFFFDNTPDVNIGKSVKMNENQFITPLGIVTFKDDIEELRISVPTALSKEQIKADYPLDISILKNDVNSVTGTEFALKNISPNKKIQLAIVTKQKLNESRIEVANIDGKLNTRLLSERVSPAVSQVTNLLLSALLYSLIIGLSTYYTVIDRDKKINKSKEHYEDIKKDLERSRTEVQKSKELSAELKKEIEATYKKINKVREDSTKRHLLIKTKLYDYSKELNFWRDTIRKMLYQNKIDNNNAEELFKAVSSSLKTYQTHKNNEHGFEELKVIAKYLNEMDKQ